MTALSRLNIAIKAFRQLGSPSMTNYAIYRLGLTTGHYRRSTPLQIYSSQTRHPSVKLNLFEIPEREQLFQWLSGDIEEAVHGAEKIVNNRTVIFGGMVAPLKFETGETPQHWTDYELGRARIENCEDIKFLWEPARFDWAATLARAYRLTGDERYPEAFWTNCEMFFKDNPPYLGPQWMSGQEAALRLTNLVFALQAFSRSPLMTEERNAWAAWLIEIHAQRILLTLPYAISQRNNHLISEAAGLITASRAIPDSPQAKKWKDTGWRWFNAALQDQITPSGTYIQHSTNYLRLVLSLALWINRISVPDEITDLSRRRLAAATRWLMDLCDRASGGVPNLGSNDGAYLFPLSSCAYSDYRPILQSASAAFLGTDAFGPGPWNEMREWLAPVHHPSGASTEPFSSTDMLRVEGRDSWATLRAATFYSRPGHADQLNVDLWWNGRNILPDAGTYLYNAAPPWQNSLSGTDVHNTVRVDEADQMLKAGKFLWLDWAQAEKISIQKNDPGRPVSASAAHGGYRRLGVIHTRTLAAGQGPTWIITDQLTPVPGTSARQEHLISLNWLLADGEWTWDEKGLSIIYPEGSVLLSAAAQSGQAPAVSLVRGGMPLMGEGDFPEYWGWFSRSYGQKRPALQITYTWKTRLPLVLTTSLDLSPVK
jgi:hypothetical protein